MKCIKNGRIILKDKILDGASLLFDKKILQIVDSKDAPSDCEVIDASGKYVAPGLIDVHFHGCLGKDCCDGDSDELTQMAVYLASKGVTSWLPTTITFPLPKVQNALDAAKKAQASGKGAHILGVNVEGPFLSAKKRGAHVESLLITPDSDFIIRNKDIVKLVTLAPELDGAEQFIRDVTAVGVRVALGHTDANYDIMMQGFNAGATHVTHLFNAMSPLSHRDPGAVGAALECDSAYCELIADTFHVHPALFKTVFRAKKDKTVLITDSIRAAGMPDGEYESGGFPVFLKGIKCCLENGTIAGSVLTLDRAVRNVMHHTDLPLWEIVNAASLNPACAIDEQHRIGSLEVGKDADIIIADEEFNICETFSKGNTIYKKP